MKYYIASKFKRRSFLREVRIALVWIGHEVTSTWLDEEMDFNSLSRAEHKVIARRDYDQIKASNVLLLDAMEPLNEGAGGGRENEYSFAQGIGLCTIRIGPARNVFHLLADFQYRNWDHFIESLQKEGEQKHGRRKKG